MQVREFSVAEEPEVVALWSECGLVTPWNDPRKDIARKLKVRPDLFLVGISGGRIVATVMAGYDGHRGWINYLAVAPSLRRQGIGRAMMREAEQRLRVCGCPKINLQVRRPNADVRSFYVALGYRDDDVVSMGKRLESDEPTD